METKPLTKTQKRIVAIAIISTLFGAAMVFTATYSRTKQLEAQRRLYLRSSSGPPPHAN